MGTNHKIIVMENLNDTSGKETRPTGDIAHLSAEEATAWHEVLAAGISSQRLVPGSIAVGGTATALYAGHRISNDVDNVLPALKENFDNVLETLEQSSTWKTARTKRPVLILGSIEGVEIGFRQARRIGPIETAAINTTFGEIVVPTLAEMIRIKAFLAYSRNVVRDYLDFAALTTCVDQEQVLSALADLDRLYGHLQTASVALEVAKALSKPEPSDLKQTDLSHYRALEAKWHDWRHTEQICQRFGLLLGRHLVGA